MFAAFPNAARLAFTGTPLITERHGERKTNKRFAMTPIASAGRRGLSVWHDSQCNIGLADAN